MLSLPQFHKPPPPSHCGECTACCVIPAHPELHKPFYARCKHLSHRCDIYDNRPDRCRKYRCAWHLGMLGQRVDRRPDKCGLLFQLEQADNGRWTIAVYELTPGAATADTSNLRYLRDMVLTSKLTRHLPFTAPPVAIYPFGADLPVDHEIDLAAFPGYQPPRASIATCIQLDSVLFTGNCRDILIPIALPNDDESS